MPLARNEPNPTIWDAGETVLIRSRIKQIRSEHTPQPQQYRGFGPAPRGRGRQKTWQKTLCSIRSGCGNASYVAARQVLHRGSCVRSPDLALELELGRDEAAVASGSERLGGLGDGGWFASVPGVAVHGEAVHAESMSDEIEVLALVSDRVGSSEPQGVVERSVDGFSVAAAFVERFEVGVRGWDRSNVFGSVEPTFGVVGGAVETDGDRSSESPWV